MQTSGYVFATGFYILDKGISNMPSREFRDNFVLQIITGSYPLFHQRFAFTCFCFVLWLLPDLPPSEVRDNPDLLSKEYPPTDMHTLVGDFFTSCN